MVSQLIPSWIDGGNAKCYTYGKIVIISSKITSVQSFNCVWLFVTPWPAAHQASLSTTNSRSLLRLMSIELMMPSIHLTLCCPLFLLPSVFPSIRVFYNESALRRYNESALFWYMRESPLDRKEINIREISPNIHWKN